MKKLITIILALLTICPLSIYADNEQKIIFTATYVNPGKEATPIRRMPTQSVSAIFKDYILTFQSINTEFILTLWDENNVLVYTAHIVPNISEYTLPTNLKGSYKLKLSSEKCAYTGSVFISS
ncbi:hypothetical protein [Prevotella sp. HUN102]|uniref:hypothetical protein n=1 Tax=Prevotella sp. HUN102 TaxID=1392486 RepID=UPI00048B60D5|nr:hypothetical protein [Prevotella sp. HUN102]